MRGPIGYEGREKRCTNDVFQVSVWGNTLDSGLIQPEYVLQKKSTFFDRENLRTYQTSC